MKTIYKLISAITFLGFGLNSSAQVATNYTFSQTNGTFSAITGGTVVGGPMDDDNAYGNLEIGFQFKYNGACYSKFGMSSNGSFAFGTSFPGTSYYALSSGLDNNVIALLNEDTRLGTFAQSTIVIGSAIVAISSSIGIAVGNTITSGYGFPFGTTVTAVSVNGFTASAVATFNFIGLVGFANGEMRYQTLGSAPNRTLVAQWLNERPYSNIVANESYNYQLRLEEATNKISIVYGAFSLGSNYHNYQVGLRGNNNSDFNNRTTLTNWSATTLGTSNTDYCVINLTLTPANGVTFNWNTNLSVPLPTLAVSVGGSTVHCGNQASGINTFFASGASSYTWSTGLANVASYSIATITSVTTIYTVVGTATNGCSSSNTVIIVVAPSPVINITGTSSICKGNSIILSASGGITYTWSTGATSSSIAPSPTSTTNYSVVGTNSFGCSQTAIKTVIVNPAPTLSIFSSDSLICAGETLTLSVDGATTFTWSEGSNTSNIIVQPAATTIYSITGKDTNGCENTAAFTQSVDACVGINQLAIDSRQFLVYPNPNKGEFSIESTQDIDIMVFNALGQIILQQNLAEGKNKIDLNNQAKGIYFIQIQHGAILNTIKIIKE